MDFVLSLVKHFNFSFFSAQVSVLTGAYQLFALLAVLFVFLYGMSVGKTRALISLLSIFAGYAMTSFFPFWNWFDALAGDAALPFLRAGVFLVAYIGTVVVMNTASLAHRLSVGETSFIKVLAVSVVQVGLLGGILMSYITPSDLPAAALAIRPFFASPLALFLWSVAALAILPFIRSHTRHTIAKA
jgi:hypothetical protein